MKVDNNKKFIIFISIIISYIFLMKYNPRIKYKNNMPMEEIQVLAPIIIWQNLKQKL